MSFVGVQLGQCGNQLGAQWYDSMCRELEPDAPLEEEEYFRRSEKHGLIARSVLVDMEPKVIHAMSTFAQKTGRWRYGKDASCWKHVGSGNNWAFGYATHGPANRDRILELVRKEVERADHLRGFLLLHSLAGGTGSGLGSFVTELLRDHYPVAHLVNHVVWPHASGEVIVQHYNAVLCLAHLNTHSDGIIITENDHLSEICRTLLHIDRPSFTDMNALAATRLSSLLRPLSEGKQRTTLRSRSPLMESARSLFCHSGYKLSTLLTIPTCNTTVKAFNNNSWKYLCSHLLQTHISFGFMEEKLDWKVKISSPTINKSIANMLIARGNDVDGLDPTTFQDSRLYPTWAVDPCLVLRDTRMVNGDDRTLSLWSNSQYCTSSLEHVLVSAQRMLQQSAYVHHYERHGLGARDFNASFHVLEQMLFNYKTL